MANPLKIHVVVDISDAHSGVIDRQMVEQLGTHTKLLQRMGKIIFTSSVAAGITPENEHAAIQGADLVVMATSKSFLATSRFKEALEVAKGKLIAPYLCQSVNLAGTGVENFEPLTGRGPALAEFSAEKREELLANVSRRLDAMATASTGLRR